MDPSKGLFRRRPSTASTRSRLRGQPSSSSASASPSISGSGGAGVANVIAANFAQSCPTSPSHSPATRRSLGGEKIPEDEEIRNPPTTATVITTTTTTTTAQMNNTTTTSINNGKSANTINANTTNSSTTTTTTTSTTTVTLSPLMATASSSKEAAEYAAAISDAKREREALHKSPPAARMRHPRVSSAGSRLVSGNAKARAAVSATVATQQSEIDKCGGGGGWAGGGLRGDGQAQLQRSASTVSGLTVRPYSSPAGLHAYTGKIPGSVPSSVHGSRLDLRELDKGSAIYLGCSAPRHSTLSLSSRTSSGSSAPPSPARTPPVSPRHSVRRAATMVKKQQQPQPQR